MRFLFLVICCGAFLGVILTEDNDDCKDTVPNVPTFKPDPTNCSFFYECAQNHWVKLECAPGLEFNAEKNVCTWPSESQCIIQSTPQPQPSSAPSQPTQTSSAPSQPTQTSSASSQPTQASTSNPTPAQWHPNQDRP